MIRFQEEAPWLKANISKAVLEQTTRKHGLGAWVEKYGHNAYKRHAERIMEQVDELSPEWRAYVHMHGWSKTKRALEEFGQRGVAKAKVLGGLNLKTLDL